MKLVFLTIVLDGFRFLPAQFYTFNRLAIPWEWHVVEGAAASVRDTGWCRPQRGRVSEDGGHGFLQEIAKSCPNVKHYWSPKWDGKTAMVNHPLSGIPERCLLMQVDADEMWTPEQLTRIHGLLSFNGIGKASYFCRYFVGPNLVTLGENCYGNNHFEWLRTWKFEPGMKFKTHEPPVLDGVSGRELSKDETRRQGLVFDHYAYAFRSQVEYKEMFYGYTNAVRHWERLQANTVWPVRLGDYLPWVKDAAQATKA